jgi:transcriptional regulator with XRE-family HTH domain
MINKGKYPGWGNFLKTRREARFKSARELCRRESLGISYPQYSRYEAGDQLPSLEQALSLGAIFGVPAFEMTIEWTLAQMPSAEAMAHGELTRLLEEARGKTLGGAPARSTPEKRLGQGVALDDVIVFNRSHLKIFGSDPAYRDVFTYVNAFGPGWISAQEISQALSMDLARVQAMLEELFEMGVVQLSGGRYRSGKRLFYFPDDEDFFGLRNFNFRHNAERILDSLTHQDVVDRKAYRGLVTRELTADQAAQLMAGIEQVLAQAVSMPETPAARTVYSLCVLLGGRFDRLESESGTAPGLTTHLPNASAMALAPSDIK